MEKEEIYGIYLVSGQIYRTCFFHPDKQPAILRIFLRSSRTSENAYDVRSAASFRNTITELNIVKLV